MLRGQNVEKSKCQEVKKSEGQAVKRSGCESKKVL